ncbi:unnamed protein product, partial [Natator depressus]
SKTAVFSKDEILCSHPGSALLSRHVPIIAGEQARRVELQRVDPKRGFCFSEFFMDGLGILLVGSCTDVSIGHQAHNPASDPNLTKVEDQYKRFRTNIKAQVQFKLSLHYFKNRLKCYSTG